MFTDLSRYIPAIPKTAPESIEELSEDLRIYKDGELDIWYAPLGPVSSVAKIWILGITPGWNQMRIAYAEAAAVLQRGGSTEDTQYCTLSQM